VPPTPRLLAGAARGGAGHLLGDERPRLHPERHGQEPDLARTRALGREDQPYEPEHLQLSGGGQLPDAEAPFLAQLVQVRPEPPTFALFGRLDVDPPVAPSAAPDRAGLSAHQGEEDDEKRPLHLAFLLVARVIEDRDVDLQQLDGPVTWELTTVAEPANDLRRQQQNLGSAGADFPLRGVLEHVVELCRQTFGDLPPDRAVESYGRRVGRLPLLEGCGPGRHQLAGTEEDRRDPGSGRKEALGRVGADGADREARQLPGTTQQDHPSTNL
jgi:hypothetical protein